MAKKHRTLDELKASGIKCKEYMTENEMLDWCKIGILAGESAAIADKYTKQGWAEWAKMLRCITTYAERIAMERLLMLDPKAFKSLVNRRNNAKMLIGIDYSKRVVNADAKDSDLVTVESDTLFDLLEVAIDKTCNGCARDDYKQCKYHDMYIALCVPVVHDEGAICPYKIIKEDV